MFRPLNHRDNLYRLLQLHTLLTNYCCWALIGQSLFGGGACSYWRIGRFLFTVQTETQRKKTCSKLTSAGWSIINNDIINNMISCVSSDIKAKEEETSPALVAMVKPALNINQKVNWGSLFGRWHPAVSVHTLWMEDHFLAVEALALFNLSINKRSEAEHLERTAPNSDSFLRSIAASAAPSRSLTGREEEELPEWSFLTCLMMSQVFWVLPDGQVSFDLLLRCYLGNVLLGFILVVTLHANFNKRLKRRQHYDSWEL